MLDGTIERRGATRSDGMIEQKVPASVTSAVLTLLDTRERRTFIVGAMDPVDTVSGATQRLARLGFYHAPDRGDDSLLAHAIETFQYARGIPVSRRLDEATRTALKQTYGS